MEKELIKFEDTNSAIPFIKVKHNNIQFNLVIDTGCTTSCIDKGVLDLILHTVTDQQTQGIIYADGSQDDAVQIVEIPITIGDEDYVEEFNAVDFRNMSQQVKDSFGITIRGLLGSEFLYKHGLILDFDKHLIRYTNGRQTSIDFGSSELSEKTNKE
jgi:hypothetical protein